MLSQGKIVSSDIATWSIDCVHNNDLVDFFKTMFEGGLDLEIAGLRLYSQVEIS